MLSLRTRKCQWDYNRDKAGEEDFVNHVRVLGLFASDNQ